MALGGSALMRSCCALRTGVIDMSRSSQLEFYVQYKRQALLHGRHPTKSGSILGAVNQDLELE